MKTIEELKQEQYDLKARLHEMIEFINNEEYFTLPPREKGLIGQQRAGMEMYLNALTNRLYGKENYSFDACSPLWPLMLDSMFNSPSWGSPSAEASKDLEEMLKEAKEESDEEKKNFVSES